LPLQAVAWLVAKQGHPSFGSPLQLNQFDSHIYVHVPLEQPTGCNLSTNGRPRQFTQFGPQAEASVIWFTQAPPQTAIPPGHEQVPPLHVPPLGHAVAHVPQWLAVLERSTHAPLQLVVPAGQLDRHWLPAHTPPAGHALPHAPQLFGSVIMSTQTPPQRVSPPAHAAVWQTPLEQVWPDAHCLPQAPQFVGSLDVLTHDPEHNVWPAGHVQAPPEQC
jgi:hypothetical protein